MAVILEFTVAAEEFLLGEVLQRATDVESIELERIVPLGEQTIPYLWVVSDDLVAFEESVRSQPAIAEIHALEVIDRQGLYRIEWHDAPSNPLVAGLVAGDAALLEAQGGAQWLFRIRFPTHDALAAFYNYCTDDGIAIHVERVHPLSETEQRGQLFELSEKQLEAVLLALERGYFDTPQTVTLDELAAELDISQQAVSDRIRRGVKRVLLDTVAPPAAD